MERVNRALMKRNRSSLEAGRLDITPERDDIQVCLITCWRDITRYAHLRNMRQ